MAGDGTQVDPALMELFQAELDTHLPVLSAGLLTLEKDGAQPNLLEAMMRAAHSIKGAARIVGATTAVKIAHVLEDCLVAAQKGQVRLDAGAVDVLLRGVDLLTRSATGPVEASDLEAAVQAIAAVQHGAPPQSPPAQPARPEQPAPVAAPVPVPAPATVRVTDLDRNGAEQLRQQLLQYRAARVTRFLFDFAEVRVVEPVALALLAVFARTPCLDGSPPRLEVVNAPPDVERLLHLTRLEVSYLLSPGGEG